MISDLGDVEALVEAGRREIAEHYPDQQGWGYELQHGATAVLAAPDCSVLPSYVTGGDEKVLYRMGFVLEGRTPPSDLNQYWFAFRRVQFPAGWYRRKQDGIHVGVHDEIGHLRLVLSVKLATGGRWSKTQVMRVEEPPYRASLHPQVSEADRELLRAADPRHLIPASEALPPENRGRRLLPTTTATGAPFRHSLPSWLGSLRMYEGDTPLEAAMRRHHGCYLTGRDLSASAGVLLARVQRYIDRAGAISAHTVAEITDPDRHQPILDHVEWHVASGLRDRQDAGPDACRDLVQTATTLDRYVDLLEGLDATPSLEWRQAALAEIPATFAELTTLLDSNTKDEP